MTPYIEATTLWKNSLGAVDHDREAEQKKEALRGTLSRFRNNVSMLTLRIANQFPQLTIHDITHLDALWETASLIAGPQYPLNPMEAFVLGGAILLHDAAHCSEAYEGGIVSIRNTVVWKDAYAAEISKENRASQDVIEQFCDFYTMRSLHARQAELLGEREWPGQNGMPSFYLIEDPELRRRYGSLIGQIAASHNWSIEDVKRILPSQFNPPGTWPIGWAVDPVKIACLLRCADAAHIDDRRAPDFLFSLSKQSGVSLNHWKAQNWLGRASVDTSDSTESSLLITSMRPFHSQDAKAWWVAYDTIVLIDAEIKSSNALLETRPQCLRQSPQFQIRRVTGSESPQELSRFVRTVDWTPTTAKIHVGNLEKLVRDLGGKQLYGDGDSFAVVIRELVQNARDAIRARMALAPNFRGRILVKVSRKSETKTVIEICDDGIGMSQRTIVGALLDFGTSFWASDLVQSEFPGLRSSTFKPVGKFGIGFYSTFMVASEVSVSSRLFSDGISDVTNLHFPDGLSLRPILSKGGGVKFNAAFSTSVCITVDEPIETVTVRLLNKEQKPEVRVPLRNYLAVITVGLDVGITLQIEGEHETRVHEDINLIKSEEQIREWITDLTFSDVLGSSLPPSAEYVYENANRLKAIEFEGRMVGYAALLDLPPNKEMNFLTTEAIGGLTHQVNRATGSYLGYLETQPTSANRESGIRVAPIGVLQTWANEQISILTKKGAAREQLYWAASNLANLELDPIEIISFPLVYPGGKIALKTIDEILDILALSPIPSLVHQQTNFSETNIGLFCIDDLPTLRPLTNGNLIQMQLENGQPKFPTSLLGCLARLASQRGCELEYEVKPNIMRTFIGTLDVLFIKLRPPHA
ncbi:MULTISPECIES: ATP-binding protein [unclassified Janthinobacterium]|uniref:HD domain-containing protein n=1 Tax=unclassified Janthinobacterium TaxID=2610881 RepID=UPI0008892782|nr:MULTISPECIES: ATP-binding protein [unclassified Janthinobacterium]SDA53829.1 Histidine kinase-, DNA gyrase B-, and HSP90-like ATPase [Janthinobacterium sp. 551a]SFB65981.1 Histidine kinase-, DNA gyrase B-, and HSP90-like ATPase [Janthinobacterium sp. 344]